jgi:hypothetical protein
MPLTQGPAQVGRQEMHLRQIEMRAFRRQDGLIDVEGRVTDQRAKAMKLFAGDRVVQEGEFVHDLWVRLIVDDQLVVHGVETSSDARPYPMCAEGGSNFDRLIGLKIGAGWSFAVKQRLGRAQGCTHLMELLIPMATAAYQAIAEVRMARPDQVDPSGRPVRIDGCTAFASDRGLVAVRWPAHYTGKQDRDAIERDLYFGKHVTPGA